MIITRCKAGLHKKKVVYETIGYEYYECQLCGKRWTSFGYSNIARAPGTQRWINGEFETMEQALEVTKEEFLKAVKEGRTIKMPMDQFIKKMSR